ncbi:MAG: hypothetical protein RLY57_556 [Candidatus Parcubacteria bacterium]|jgi:hypothetical protein
MSITGEVKYMCEFIDLDESPVLPDRGWTVVEHRKGGRFEWNPSRIGFYVSKRQIFEGEDTRSVDGNGLREELLHVPVFNANLLSHLLKHPHLIPEEWKFCDSKHEGESCPRRICFWGTIYQSPAGSQYVLCLVWDMGEWRQNLEWLVPGFQPQQCAAYDLNQ